MPKKKEMKETDCCETHDEHECCCCCCPIGRIFCRCKEHHGEHEMPEFMGHFMSARKDILMGIREMIDWKIEKIDEKKSRMEKRRVKKVDIR